MNEPPSSLTPERFADTFVERFSGVAGVTVEVWDEERIAAERLGGLLGVARGSAQPPRLVRVEYQPADPIEIDGRVPHLALVGKGITFDSGGLSLKTATGMETMKTDMSGAAAVLSAVDAAAALGARIRITAFTPLTENMPGGSATKPGDVLTTRSGKTIEVLNTDAEGRLVLADGLTLAAEVEPDAIMDLATLTGAAVVALGKEIAGLLGNDDDLMAELRAAGERAGEPLWPLPLPDDYRSHIDSEIADMRNVGRPGQAGSIAAALLLREFVARRALGPSRHRRAGPLGREQPVPDQGRHRFRRPHPGRAGDLRAVRRSARVAGPGPDEDRRARSGVVGHHGRLVGRAAARHGAVGRDPDVAKAVNTEHANSGLPARLRPAHRARRPPPTSTRRSATPTCWWSACPPRGSEPCSRRPLPACGRGSRW